MEYKIKSNTPKWLIFLVTIALSFATIPFINLIWMGLNNLTIFYGDKLSLSSLGQLGDFFGGHISAFSGSLSLALVIFFTFHQSKQQNYLFSVQRKEEEIQSDRVFFLDGVNLITQWDIKSPGCDQSMRLLDYYSRLAFQKVDDELFLILNTVITADIRKNLEGKNESFRKTNYPYACEAINKIGELRKKEGLSKKIGQSA